jgi:hypothetical protein
MNSIELSLNTLIDAGYEIVGPNRIWLSRSKKGDDFEYFVLDMGSKEPYQEHKCASLDKAIHLFVSLTRQE